MIDTPAVQMSAPTPQVYLVRHGETSWTISRQHTGRTDIALTERGERDAQALSAPLKGLRFTEVLTSPLRRARRTAELSFDSRSLAFALRGASQQDDDLYVMISAHPRELRFQIQEGTTKEWRRVIDTSLESPHDILESGSGSPLQSLHYQVPGRTIVVLVRDRGAAPPQ